MSGSPETSALIDQWRKRLARPASVGTFTTPGRDPFGSCFGRIGVQAPGETWPQFQGRPMQPLLQVNVAELPYIPESIRDLAMIRVWIGENFEPEPAESGRSWCVRASRSLTELVASPEAVHAGEIKASGLKWTLLEADYPSWDDAPIDELPEQLHDDYHDHFECASGLKVGGWPRTVQSEIFWAPNQKHPASPEYVLQVDSEPDLNWMWGDCGFGYFGRGTGKLRDAWAFEWQCF